MFALLHAARPVLLNLGERGAIDLGGWSDRVRLVAATATRRPVGAARHRRGPPPRPAVLIRPDGHVDLSVGAHDPSLPPPCRPGSERPPNGAIGDSFVGASRTSTGCDSAPGAGWPPVAAAGMLGRGSDRPRPGARRRRRRHRRGRATAPAARCPGPDRLRHAGAGEPGRLRRPEAPWLVAVFTSATCDTCAGVWERVQPVESDVVAVQELEYVAARDLHDRYAIDAVPTTLIIDADGVVQSSFLGPVTATDLWAAVAEAREPGSTPDGCASDEPPSTSATAWRW